MNKTDLTMRMGRTGDWATASTLGERVCNIVQMLFHTIPGTDDYNKDMGLDIAAQSQRSYVAGERDTAYEARIIKQFSEYTDLIVNSAVAVYDKKLMYVFMSAVFEGETINLRVTSGPENLSVAILPKDIH